MLYIVLAYLMLFAALTNSVCLNNASFFFLFKYFLCQGYELSGEIALKNNHYYYCTNSAVVLLILCTLVHTDKCKFYTERISLASSSKELHQIVNAFSNRHPPSILPAIYPSADLPSIFIKHFANKVEKLRANIASEHVTSKLVTGTTAATFSSFVKVSQLTVKECILNPAPKSCELDTITSILLIECLDSILPSLTDLFNSFLLSGIFQQCF